MHADHCGKCSTVGRTRGHRHPWQASRATLRAVALRSTQAVSVALALTTALSFPVARTQAQQMTTAAIADSPTAQTLFGDVRAQAEANPAESARLARRLLDEYGGRMIKVGAETDDLFTSVSAEVERFLLAHPEILARFRDMETRGAERMLAEEGPSVTAARRRLTAPGLSATIELAERAVRGDQPLEAISLLSRVRDHPDLSADRAVAHAVLESMALRRIGDAAGSDAALARAGAVAGVDRGAVESAMSAARRTTKGGGGVLGRSPLVTAPDGGDPDSTWREIWALDLDQSLFRRIYGGPVAGRTAKDVESVRSNARLMVAIPTVLGNRVLLSEGHRVRSVDIDSRDEIWSREIGSVGVGRESAPIGDLSAVTADSGIAVVYEGHAAANERTASPRVWALDPATGAVKWNTVVDGCDGRAELAGLFPTGAPLLVSDLVVVATRKPTQRLEQVDWLLALDRADGQLRWALSIAGAPVTRFSTGRQHSGLATDGAVVIDTTPLGAVACVRASDGAVEWLRRFPVPLRDPRSLAEPWEVAARDFGRPGDRDLSRRKRDRRTRPVDRPASRRAPDRPGDPVGDAALSHQRDLERRIAGRARRRVRCGGVRRPRPQQAALVPRRNHPGHRSTALRHRQPQRHPRPCQRRRPVCGRSRRARDPPARSRQWQGQCAGPHGSAGQSGSSRRPNRLGG